MALLLLLTSDSLLIQADMLEDFGDALRQLSVMALLLCLRLPDLEHLLL